MKKNNLAPMKLLTDGSFVVIRSAFITYDPFKKQLEAARKLWTLLKDKDKKSY